ncbi:MAG TPA: hypothetical protein VFX13_06270 [Gaiellales bacterium]|jgi:hypothetical protein|nr:hypothetical protein [Gaiellales bacterium]
MQARIVHPPSDRHTDPRARGMRDVDLLREPVDLDDAAAGAVPALRCASCGYAIASYRTVPSCPMCHTRRWIADRRMIPAHDRLPT